MTKDQCRDIVGSVTIFEHPAYTYEKATNFGRRPTSGTLPDSKNQILP